MACCVTGTNSNTNSSTTNYNNGSIAQLLKRLDQIQKEAIIANAANQCDNCMISAMYNTKPIGIYFCNNGVRFEANLGEEEDTTNLFRVEEVRGDETVVLRLLEDDGGDVTCTTYTIVVRISCIGAVQCFEPINCETLCSQLI